MAKVTLGFMLPIFLLMVIFVVPVSAADTLTYGSGPMNDNIIHTVGSTPGSGIVSGGTPGTVTFSGIEFLIINGGDGNDTLTINGSDGDDNFTFAAGSIPCDGSYMINYDPAVTFSGIENVVINGGGGNDTFNISPSTSVVINNIDGGSGIDTLVVDAQGKRAWYSGSAVVFYDNSGFNNIPCAGLETVTFLNAATISGTKFNDVNSTGVKDSGETGLPNWQIYIDIDINGSYDAGEPTATTDASGNYSFTLPPGTYRVREVGQNGWTQSTANPSDITLIERQQATDVNFGNYQPPDLLITKTHTGIFKRGQNGAAYTIVVSNNGTGPTIWEVRVHDILPAGLTATALGGTGWNCDLSTLTCTRSDALIPGDGYPSITLLVNVAQSANDTVTNSVTVFGDLDINTANNSANDPTDIISEADQVISKTGDTGVVAGTNFTYTIRVTNNGPSNATGIVVTDLLPAGVTFYRSTPSQGTYSSSTGNWAVGSLASEETAFLNIEVTASALPNTVITNTAQVIGNEIDLVSNNNSASLNTRVVTAVGGEVMGISKPGIIAPWLALCLVLASGGAFLLSRRRKGS